MSTATEAAPNKPDAVFPLEDLQLLKSDHADTGDGRLAASLEEGLAKWWSHLPLPDRTHVDICSGDKTVTVGWTDETKSAVFVRRPSPAHT